MRQDEIINLARMIKQQYGTDSIKIAEDLDIEIQYMSLKPSIYPAYTINVKKPIIKLNNHFTSMSQRVLCAHELGHALLHKNKIINQFDDDHNGIYEYEANLFAVALLFNQEDLNFNIASMDNYLLKKLLDYNIKLKV